LKRKRLDGRSADEIRPLEIKINYLPVAHGSALFSRGNTKVLSAITIGKMSEKQLIDNVFTRFYKHFIHHYNFPSFAVNELTSRQGISRREIGHGELVEKTFNHLTPSVNLFPYTIRAVSEVFSSDGSSSQAAICATSLALMSTGIPLVRPVAGIALGLFEGQIYSDINGLEDKLGEMDFKIAGTEKGICSAQLDVKNQGISIDLLKKCLQVAYHSRFFILKEMKKYVPHTNSKLPDKVFKCQRILIGKENISKIIGRGGKVINQLISETNATIEIQPDGCILVYYFEEKQLKLIYQSINRILI
jgi:polyribonucleotide nucleotidyltransferase